MTVISASAPVGCQAREYSKPSELAPPITATISAVSLNGADSIRISPCPESPHFPSRGSGTDATRRVAPTPARAGSAAWSARVRHSATATLRTQAHTLHARARTHAIACGTHQAAPTRAGSAAWSARAPLGDGYAITALARARTSALCTHARARTPSHAARTGLDAEQEAEVDVHDVARGQDHDVAVVSVLHLHATWRVARLQPRNAARCTVATGATAGPGRACSR